ncbi:MAG: hypothetical protein RR315_02545 [Oscillospiraceae bacterium]
MDLEKWGKKIQAVAETTAKKAGDQVQIARLSIDKATFEKEMADAFTALGRHCYLNYEKENMVLSGIKEYKADIDNLKLKIAAIEREIEEVKASCHDSCDFTVPYEEKTDNAEIAFTSENESKPENTEE